MISVHPTAPNPNTPWAYSKGFELALGHSLDELSEIITRSVWSPNVFKNGHRINDNFSSSFFLVLDFDNGHTTLRDAGRLFCDYRGIIGTSKSHGVITEKNPDAHDRFRVVIPWEKPISDPLVYAYNMELAADRYDCDASCVDLARYYFPCKQIVACTDGEDYYAYSVLPVPYSYRQHQAELTNVKREQLQKDRRDFKRYGRLKPWHERFLNRGILPEKNASRRWCMFLIALHMYLCGADDRDVFDLLAAGNYDKTGLTNLGKEIEGRMKSARKKADVILASLETVNPSSEVLPSKLGL